MADQPTPVRPFIFVGVGGTGGKTLGIVRKTVSDALERAGWDGGWPAAWQFVQIDVPAAPDTGAADPAFALPRSVYVPLSSAKSTYAGYHQSISQQLQRTSADAVSRYLAWDSWHPEPPESVRVDITQGAGQYRAVGRVAALHALKDIDSALKRARDAAVDSEANAQLRRALQEVTGQRFTGADGADDPVVFVVGSVAGGSGSGMFLDVCDVLRAHGHSNLNSILFTPEVFQRPTGAIDPGVAPNTFLALTEASNSLWITSAEDAPVSRTLHFARAGVSEPTGHDTSTTFLLVGRRNSTVAFDSADDVFKIVGRSVGELVLDPALTANIVAYDMANSQAVAEGGTDNLGLSASATRRDIAPFRSMGFARMTVGRDFFDRYATDRILKQAGTRLLEGHLERRRPDDLSSDEELKDQAVDEAWPGFLDDIGLDVDTIDRRLNVWDDDGFAATRQRFTSALQNEISTLGQQHRRRIPTPEARQALVNRLQVATREDNEYSADVATVFGRLVTRLAAAAQEDVRRVVLHAAASYGLPVTIDLIARLIESSRGAAAELRQRAATDRKHLTDRLAVLSRGVSGEPNDFTRDNSDFSGFLVSSTTEGLQWHVSAQRRAQGADVLEDLTDNLLVPWRDALRDAAGLLRMDLYPELGASPLDIWPGEHGVPDYLQPSKVEFLLDDTDTFADQFVHVIERSLSGAQGRAAVARAVEDIIQGRQLGLNARGGEVARTERPWVPELRQARPAGQNRSTAQIHLAFGVEDIATRTHAWLHDREKFVGKFLSQSLADYLTDPMVDAAERRRREDGVVGAFDSMVRSSRPLVALDPALTNLIHGSAEAPYRPHASALNIPSEATDLRQRLQDSAASLLGDPSAVRFTTDPRSDAMMMTLLREPYHLVEIASIMAPIVEQWQQSTSTRMWNFRRARPLPEWVPLSPAARRALITGWFAERLLGRATITVEGNKPVLSVEVDSTRHQLPQRGVREATPQDHVGLLLEGLFAAFVEVYRTKTLDALVPYQHLIGVGASVPQASNDVVSWVAGSVQAPGAADLQDPEARDLSRQDAAHWLIAEWRTGYEAIGGRLHNHAAAQAHATYEVIHDVLEALTTLDACVERGTGSNLPGRL
ncbi:tubulin-like doman-containing protein [Nesterenkonia alba]|uniref:tubulin-like doman-containing protein n=1 Tax=Nesterenkonia alba TaxID=515814 RepID=UPI0003B6AF04|nr:tubulin-like doman-containing protein [Nesterenkonia alba]